MELALDLLAMDLTNDPDPVRFDGTPPRLEQEPVLLASLFDIAGYLVRKAFADTGDDDAVYFYINDHLGTPQIITDETGNIVWKGDYQPFGSVNAVVSDLENNFRFAGQYYDEETGLHYNYHRYYDPGTGRYLTPDPIGHLGGLNLFAYVINNPINFIDPYGLEDMYQGYAHFYPHYKNINHHPKLNLTPKQEAAFLKGVAAGIGITIGTLTENPKIGVFSFWAVDSLFSYLNDGPITDPYTGIEFINPPEVDGSNINNACSEK